MPEIVVEAQKGRVTGSAPARRLRREGKVPGVLYGHGVEPVPLAVEARSLRAALSGEAGLNALLELRLDGDSHLTMARELQRDPVRNTVAHVDFVIVRRDEIVSTDVGITLVGEAIEVLRGDGVVSQELNTLHVKSTPLNIPNLIEVDVSALQIGDAIRVGDIKLPEGVSTDVDPEAPVVVGQPPQVSEADLVSEAEAEAAELAGEEVPEGAEAASEEGEAAPAEGEGEAPAESEG